jgi:hypothetical protein
MRAADGGGCAAVVVGARCVLWQNGFRLARGQGAVGPEWAGAGFVRAGAGFVMAGAGFVGGPEMTTRRVREERWSVWGAHGRRATTRVGSIRARGRLVAPSAAKRPSTGNLATSGHLWTPASAERCRQRPIERPRALHPASGAARQVQQVADAEGGVGSPSPLSTCSRKNDRASSRSGCSRPTAYMKGATEPQYEADAVPPGHGRAPRHGASKSVARRGAVEAWGQDHAGARRGRRGRILRPRSRPAPNGGFPISGGWNPPLSQ